MTIQRHISGTTNAIFFFVKYNNWHGSFRRNAIDLSPHVSIKHYIADHTNFQCCKRFEQLLKIFHAAKIGELFLPYSNRNKIQGNAN